MRKFKRTTNRRQLTLLPQCIEDYIPTEDIVRYIDTVVDELDISNIEEKYSYDGRPAYEPQIIIKILLYGKMRGIRSSRELSRAVRENLRFIYLASNEKPDFRTIINFRKKFHKQLGELFKQTVKIGLRENFINLEHVCIDGTKLRAFAGRNSFKRPEKLKEILEKLEEEIIESYEGDIELDKEEDNLYGKEDREAPLPKELQDKAVMVKKIKKALKEHEEINRESKPKRMSTTDSECRYMKSKGILPSYNAQIAVDAKSRMAVGGLVSNCCTDNGQLIPVLESIKEKTGRDPKAISVDKGYADHKGLLDVERRKIDGYIPGMAETSKKYSFSDFQYDKEEDVYICPNSEKLHRIKTKKKKHKKGRKYECENCKGCKLRDKCMRNPRTQVKRSLKVPEYIDKLLSMQAKVETEKGKKISKLRGATVEPVIGYIKYSKKLRRFIFRGLEMVNAMWKFELAAYNIERWAKELQQKQKNNQALLA